MTTRKTAPRPPRPTARLIDGAVPPPITVTEPDPTARPRTPYPHVDTIGDWRAQQSIRLLWDRAYDLEARLQAAETTVADLTTRSNQQDTDIAAVRQAAGEALAIAQPTHAESLSLGPGPGPGPGPTTPRGPLPPFDTGTTDPDTNAPLPVYTVLREAPPSPDVGWWRGNAWAITLAGLPAVPGGASGAAQNRVLTYFLDRYDRTAGTVAARTWETQILNQHVNDGYTHISLSPQDSFAQGMSVDDYVAMSVRCRNRGLFVHHLLRSKLYTDLNAPNLDDVNGLVNRLLDAGALQVATPAWEMNSWSPENVRAMIDHDAALIGTRCVIMLHFLAGYISWPPPTEDSASFWRKNHGKVDGLCYQCNPTWSAGMMAARINDGLDRLAPNGIYGLGLSGRNDAHGVEHPIWYVAWETIATQQFNNLNDGDGRLATEDIGDLKGYENLCAPGLMIVRGFGNGGRRPDGTAL